MSTQITTGKVRFSYCNLFTPRAVQEGATPKYSVTLLIPKSDKATTTRPSRPRLRRETLKSGTTVPWAFPTQIRPRPSRRPSRITALYLRSRSPALCLRRKRRPNAKSLTAMFARSAGRKLRRPPTSASFAVSARSLWRGLTKRTPEWPVSRPKFSEGKSKGLWAKTRYGRSGACPGRFI